MQLYPNWNEWKARRVLAESKGQAPSYAFDNWLKMTKSFGDEISSFVGQAKEKDQELDDEIEKKKKEPPEKDDADAGDSEKSKDKETAWKKLRDIAKERMEKDKKEDAKKPAKPSSKSSRSS
jgi:hypothetical protein